MSDIVGANWATFAFHPVDRAHVLGVELEPQAEPTGMILGDEDGAATLLPASKWVSGSRAVTWWKCDTGGKLESR